MRKTNKFKNIFWVGIIPISLASFVVIMIALGVLYSAFKKKPDQSVTEIPLIKQDTPKPEKIYIHDTVYLKVPHVCHKEHVESKPVVAEPAKDANDTNNADNSIN
jgi:hypothetical protein